MPGFLSRLLRFLLKLVIAVFAAALAVGLLLVALVVLALSLLKSLITGRKPVPAMVFGRFQKFSPQGMWPGQTPRADAGKGDIVDVEVREIRDEQRLP